MSKINNYILNMKLYLIPHALYDVMFIFDLPSVMVNYDNLALISLVNIEHVGVTSERFVLLRQGKAMDEQNCGFLGKNLKLGTLPHNEARQCYGLIYSAHDKKVLCWEYLWN